MSRRIWAPMIAASALIAVLALHIPLGWVVLVLGTVGAFCAWRWPEFAKERGTPRAKP